MDLGGYLGLLDRMTAADLRAVAASLGSDSLTDEVEWWRATIAIDRALRHAKRTRLAARAARDAVHAVQHAASRGRIELPDPDVTRVARAAAEIARGLVAGPTASPVVRLLVEHWATVVAPR